MLTSSDAKWRCMWHLLVWSLNLTLVSQFLYIGDHVSFYVLAAVSILILPVLTAVYSNTAGRHGAGLLRAGLVFCDPVIACLTITPVLLLHHLPSVIDEYYCLQSAGKNGWNQTLECIINHTDIHVRDMQKYVDNVYAQEDLHSVLHQKQKRFLIIQGSVVIPAINVVMMGKRTRKMMYSTFLILSAYWLIVSIEATDLLQAILVSDVHKHVIYTTEAMICIVMIIAPSYAVVTLISYTSPMMEENKVDLKFDLIYKAFSAFIMICFVEIPFVVARCNILSLDNGTLLMGTFYFWLIKDFIFIGLMIVMVIITKFGQDFSKLPFHSGSASSHLFEPEKRDVYIHKVEYDAVKKLNQERMTTEMSVMSNTDLTTVNENKARKPTHMTGHLHVLSKKRLSDSKSERLPSTSPSSEPHVVPSSSKLLPVIEESPVESDQLKLSQESLKDNESRQKLKRNETDEATNETCAKSLGKHSPKGQLPDISKTTAKVKEKPSIQGGSSFQRISHITDDGTMLSVKKSGDVSERSPAAVKKTSGANDDKSAENKQRDDKDNISSAATAAESVSPVKKPHRDGGGDVSPSNMKKSLFVKKAPIGNDRSPNVNIARSISDGNKSPNNMKKTDRCLSVENSPNIEEKSSKSSPDSPVTNHKCVQQKAVYQRIDPSGAQNSSNVSKRENNFEVESSDSSSDSTSASAEVNDGGDSQSNSVKRISSISEEKSPVIGKREKKVSFCLETTKDT